MDRFVLALLFCSAEMSAVAAVYILLLRLLKNKQAAVLRYYSWLIIIAGFLLPVKPELARPVVTVSGTAPLPADTNAAAQTAPALSIYTVLFWVWLTGAAGYLLCCLVRYRSFQRSIKRLSSPADESTLSLALQTAEALGITAPVRVLTLPEISTPMMTGLLSPTVLLPEKQFEPAELRLILKHELTHFKHRDLWCRLPLTLCRAVHWFNPIMPVISRSLDRECEYYCDQSVVADETAEQKMLYCRSILNTVSRQNARRSKTLRPVMATNFCTPKQGLKHRLGLILSGRRRRRYFLVGVIALALTAASGSVIAFAGNEAAAEPPSPPAVTEETRYVEVTTTTVSRPSPPEYEQETVKTTTTVSARRLAETTVKGQTFETDTGLRLTTPAQLNEIPPEQTVTTVTAVTDESYALSTAIYEQ